MSKNEVEILKKALEREKKDKANAEKIIEQRILDLTKKIRSHEYSMSVLLNNMLDAIFVFSQDGSILSANKAAYLLSGHKFEEQGLNHIDNFTPKNRDRVKKILEKAFKTEDPLKFDFPFISAEKERKIVNVRTTHLQDEHGVIYGLQVIATDITSVEKLKEIQAKERRQLKIENEIFEAVLKTDNLYEIGWKIVESIAKFLETDDAVLYAKINNELVQIASLKEQLEGFDKIDNPLKLNLNEGIVGMVATSKTPKIIKDTSENPEYVIEEFERFSEITVPILLDDELIGIIDSEHPKKNHYTKSHLDFLVKVSNFIALGLKNSINELKIQQKDKALKLSAERLEIIIENLPRGIAFENKNQHIALLNQKFIDLLGLPSKKEKIIGLHREQLWDILEQYFPKSERFTERTIEIIKQNEIVRDDTLILKDGRSVTRHCAPVYQDGEFMGNLWAYADNTIETRFYENLNYEREKYVNIIANMEIGLLEVDNEDRILTANNAFLKMTNYNEEDLIGNIGNEILVSKAEAERIKKMNATRLEGESSIYEIQYLTKDKKKRYMLVSGGPNRDISGNVIGSIGIHLDITKLKELENLREKLITDLTDSNDELSNYAHVVSHDLKTPLRSISAAMNWLKEDNQDKLDEMSHSYLEIVDESLVKMDKIISDTLRYSELKQRSGIDAEVDLNSLLRHLIEELKKSYPKTKIEIVGKLPVININETKAIQIFQNILDNACKYRDHEKKSKVTIKCLTILGFFEFHIKDNGIGIEKKYESRVFEIFQKLNNNPESNGIGMSIVKKIIETYGGKIWFESEVGKGTTFKFNIPKTMRAK